jgi:dienelactone hydrolase
MTLRTILPAIALLIAATPAFAEPATVYFPSADGQTRLVGYLFMPTTPGPHPAVVMLHGRGGPYSLNNNKDCTLVAEGTPSACNAATLSKRHQSWGDYWAAHGFIALLPDSFGPRGKGHGFGRHTHGDADREDVNERTVRPLDAEGALKYLQARGDVTGQRIYLQGWSNGASTTLNVMYRQALASGTGFRAAIDPAAKSSPIEVVDYQDATHDFDDPGKKRQSEPGNQDAREDVLKRAAEIFGK